MQHAKYSASGSARWLACPASIRMERDYPSETNDAAEEGTRAHDQAQTILQGGTVENVMEYVQDYVDYVKAIPGELFVERRLDYGFGFGTSDAVIVDHEHDLIHIVDLKYGFTPVDVDDNSQLALYALGAMKEFEWIFEPSNFKVHIYQPRIGNIASDIISRDSLLAFESYCLEQVALAEKPDAPFGPSDKACKYCKAKSNCKALNDYIAADFENLEPADYMSDERMIEVLTNASLITEWVKSIKESALQRVLAGGEIPGFKLVRGPSRRKWADESEAMTVLGPEFKTLTLLTPTQAEKVGTIPEGLVIKPEGSLTLVPVSDKRKAVGDVSDDFDICT